jgi:hypothetical protein
LWQLPVITAALLTLTAKVQSLVILAADFGLESMDSRALFQPWMAAMMQQIL